MLVNLEKSVRQKEKNEFELYLGQKINRGWLLIIVGSEEKGGVKDASSLSKMSNGWVEVRFPETGNSGGRKSSLKGKIKSLILD